MSWSLSAGPVEQGAVRDALEAKRDEVAESYGGFSDEVRSQQDAAFAAAETVVDKAEFGGNHVTITASGHVRNGDAPTYVSVSVNEKVEG